MKSNFGIACYAMVCFVMLLSPPSHAQGQINDFESDFEKINQVGVIYQEVQLRSNTSSTKSPYFGSLDFQVFPSPAVDHLYIQFEDDRLDDVAYSIYSSDGKLVHQQILKENQLKLDTKDYLSGNYFIKLTHNGQLLCPMKTFAVIK